MQPVRLHVDRVLIGPGHHVCAPSHDRLQRARAAREVADPDVEPLVLEIPEPFRQCQGKVVERRLASNRDMHILLLDLGVHARGQGKRGGHGHCAKRCRYGIVNFNFHGALLMNSFYSARLSISACDSVPASTYSSSPPRGTPRAIRLTLIPRLRSISAM